jgi:hypothetical protein
MTCYTASQLAELDAQLQKTVEEAVVEAVNEAVAPYRIQVEIVSKDLAAMELQRNTWRAVGIGAISSTLVCLLVLAVSWLK